MDILTSHLGLALAFVIIASLFLYFIIGSKAPVLVKVIIIPIVIWFTLVLYFTPGKLMGWPTIAEPPEGSIILMPIIREPSGGEKGFIDLIVIVRDESKKSLVEQLGAKNIFFYNDSNTERIYRLPYDRKLHKQLEEAKKKSRRQGGFMTYSRKKKLKKGGRSKDATRHKDDSRIKVVNPVTILNKDAE